MRLQSHTVHFAPNGPNTEQHLKELDIFQGLQSDGRLTLRVQLGRLSRSVRRPDNPPSTRFRIFLRAITAETQLQKPGSSTVNPIHVALSDRL
ncbi:hypothetical protein EVAR_33568_1 [Eumeta japonica]|uniref:Uncharacterized protein n=1 Tax=Eumeta variegata TaxID=151549 RepID=A0A4C1VKK0_EUMVA|nr:hypothetical protein EVAR_33568_1 [Eumeta japonica]